ncbi:MAG: HAMP domain-containing protein [Chromatiaceae bacterium]|nr:HAMP domain-containing protein [Chromatiaceae bacterium]
MGFFRDLSIRNKILGGFALVLLAVLGLGLSSIGSLSTVQGKVQTLVEQSTPAALKSVAISDLIKEATASLGFHLLSKTEEDAATLQRQIGQVDGLLLELEQLPAISADESSQAKLEEIKKRFAELKGLTPKMLAVAASDELNLKAMSYANRNTNPVFREKLQQLTALIEAERAFEPESPANDLPGPDADGNYSVAAANELVQHAAAATQAQDQARRDLFYHLVTLRYRWLSLNNEVRLFLAFRAPQAVENVATYQASVVGTLEEVAARSELFTFEQEEAFTAFTSGLDEFWRGLDRLIELHQGDDWRQDAFLVRTRISPLVKLISDDLNELVERQKAAMHDANAEIVDIYIGKRTGIIVTIALIVAVVGFIAWMLARGITRPLARAVEVAGRVAHGDLGNVIKVDANDETGQLMQSLDAMQRDLRRRIDADAAVAAGNLRIRQALDNVGVPVTVSDGDNILIYMNTAARALFTEMEGDWKKEFPAFSAHGLVGQRLSDYLSDQGLLVAFRAKLSSEETIEGPVAGRIMRLVASPVYDTDGGYQGRVTQWIDRTEELAELERDQVRLQAEREVAAENQRIRIALDNVSSNVMMADTGHNIVYLNRAALALFKEAADDLRQELPEFDPDRLLGGSIDAFHKRPEHQAGLLASLTSTHTTEVNIGPRTMRIVANPVVDEDGRRLGTAVEWTDRTAEVAVEQEIDALVAAARAGDLRQRVNEAGKRGFFKSLATGFNALLDELSEVFDEIAHVMSAMADGNLEQRLRGEYRGTFGEVQGNMNRTLDNLRDIIVRMRDAADEVGTAAEQINGGNQNLSSRTEQQASSLQETASSLEQLTATVRNNADNARQANQVATGARATAQRGGEVVGEAIAAMEQINAASSQIAEIIGVIDEIAFQTNLLALNASVEAARAGEQGRGFAVVASEVRNLASRSANAAREIKDLIRDSVDKVQAGSELVNQSGATLEEIVAGVKKVGDIIAEISAASNEQSTGIDQVNQAVSTMDQMTQQNAALAEQTSAASQAMRDNAANMRELMAFFKMGAGAAGRPVAPATITPAVAPAGRSSVPTRAAAATTRAPAPKPRPVQTPKPSASRSEALPAADDDGEWEEF